MEKEKVLCKVKSNNRPTCSCGLKMKSQEYEGYYDSFMYWVCENCDLSENGRALERKGEI